MYCKFKINITCKFTVSNLSADWFEMWFLVGLNSRMSTT